MNTNISHFSQLEIPFQKILFRLGFLNGKTKLDKKLEDLIKEEVKLAQKLINPKQIISNSYIEFIGPDEISLEPHFKIKSSDIHNLFHGCVKAYGFAVTIGPALEKKRDHYISQKEATKALVLDAVGSVVVEELAEITDNQIGENILKEDLSLTLRFSPGYGDWNISGQKDFFKWLGAEAIGIKLTDKFQMLPEKSVSAIVGAKRNG